MTKTQLQTLSDLVSIAHEKYDGNPFYKPALERFDALLVIMNINAAKENAPGNAALSAPPRNCDCAKDEAESAFAARFGRPWNTAEDELASWLFDLAEGGAS